MNWPDPGTPPPRDESAHDEDDGARSAEHDVAPPHGTDGPVWLSSDDLASSPRPREQREPSAGNGPTTAADATAEPRVETPTYAQLRSESDPDRIRWQHATDDATAAGDADPSRPEDDSPDGDSDAPPHHVTYPGPVADDRPEDHDADRIAWAEASATPPPAGGSEPDPEDATGEPDADAPTAEERTGGTHEDASSAAFPGDGPPAMGDPGSSPHAASSDAVPGPPGAPRGATVGDGTASFHGERDAGDGAAFHGEHPAPGGPAPSSASASAIEDALAGLETVDRHATVICVANQKGGVGKTTTTVSLGAALAMEGAQVLVVDLDPQGNATTGLGLRAQEGAPSTYRVIVEQMDVEDAAEPTAVRGLHVLPSSLDLAGAEIELVPAFSRENRLKQALDGVRDLYDVILIDCPPSLGLLTINALVAADQVLVPIQCEYYALEGLGQLMRTVKLVADSLNRGLAVGGVVLTMFDGRTNLSQQVVDEVRGYFGDIAYQTIVPRTVRLSEAPSYGQPIGVFDASSRGARAYERLAREVARRLGLDLEDEDVSPLDRLLGSSRPSPPEEPAPLPTDLAPDDVPAAAESPEAPHAADGEGAEHAGEHPDGGEHHPPQEWPQEHQAGEHQPEPAHPGHPQEHHEQHLEEHGHHEAHEEHGHHEDHGEHGHHEDHGEHGHHGEHHGGHEHHDGHDQPGTEGQP